MAATVLLNSTVLPSLPSNSTDA